MLKVILFSALLGTTCATFLSYEDIDHSNLGLIDVDDVRPHYTIPAVQSHIPIEFSEHDSHDLVVEDEIGKPLEQMSVEAYPKYPSHLGSKMKQGNYKGSDSSAEIKQKKHSYESTKVSQEHIEVKSVNNHYGSRIPHQQHKPSGYDQAKHVPSKGIYRKKLPEQKKESGEPGDYSHSIGEKNEPKQLDNKHYHHHQPEPVQKHIEPEFKGPSMKYDHHTQSSHSPIQQKTYESGAHPKHIGHKNAYEGHSSYKMSPKHKEISYQKPQTHGIYREGPKKYPSSYHNSGPKTHHSGAPNGNYHHGIKGHGPYPGPHHHKDSGYKNSGGNSGYHGINIGNNDHYSHGGSGIRGSHPGHYNQPKYPSIKSHLHPTYNSGHMTYHRGGGAAIGHSAGYKNMQSGYGIPRSNPGYHAISGPQYSSHEKHYSESPSYHHNTHNIKKSEYYPKSIKTSGIIHHSLGGGIAPGYSRPIMSPGYHNSGSGHRVYTVPLIRMGHHSKKGYSQPILTQEKHTDDIYSTKSGIGEPSYHIEKSPSYHKTPAPQRPHYHAEPHSKPPYGGHHTPKEYHGIGENNAKPSYSHNHGGSRGPSEHQPTYHKNQSIKGGPNGSAYKHGSYPESSKKYLPVTASHENSYKTGSSRSPIEQHKYKPSRIEQKDIGHGSVLGGHGSPSGSNYGSSESSHEYKPPKIEQKDIGYEERLGGHGSPSGISSGSGYGSSESSHKYKPSKIEQKDIGYEERLGGHGSPSGISSGSGYGSSESSHKYKPSKIEQKDIGYEGLLGGHGNQNPTGISSGLGYGSNRGLGSHGSPSSSSHDVYSSDENYEMSKPMPYEFKYDVKDDEHGADQYREEKMDENGYLTGRYGYKDPHGLYRQVEYEASKAGFKVSSIKTNEPGTENEDPADVHFEVEKNSQPHY